VSILWLVLSLANREPTAARLVADRGLELASVIVESDATWAEREELLSIAHHESRFDYTAIGDQGRAVGAWQIHTVWRVGVDETELRVDPVLQVRLTLKAIRHLRAACGGTRLHWMGAFACGTCGACPAKARELCSPIGCS
jgi:hypothetical protein